MKKRSILRNWLPLALVCLFLAGCSAETPQTETAEPLVESSVTEAAPEGLPKETEPAQTDAPETEKPAETEKSAETETKTDPYEPKYTLIDVEGMTDMSVGTFVATYNVLDFDIDPTGQEDCTSEVQKLLNKIGNLGGGTLYFPTGFYKIERDLTIPKGVTIRGDWKEPTAGEAMEGTVLMAYTGRGKGLNDTPFMEMEVGAGLMNVIVWYPEQTPDDIQPYSPAVTFGVNGYFGNEYNNVKNVTFVNAYTAVHFSYTNGGASPVVNGLYGSPLSIGVEVDNIADVGRVEWLDLSPEYWIGCGLYEKMGMDDPFKTEANAESVRDYIYNNAVGLIMRRNDWSYACWLNIEGYSKGFAAMASVASEGSSPNGHNYGFTFTNCKTGISIEASNYVGIMFADVDIVGCETGISIGAGTSDVAQFSDCTIDADTALLIDATSGTRVLMNQCVIESGEVLVNGGILNVTDSDFNNNEASAHISINASGRANVIGNRFEGEANIKNNSFFESNIDHTPTEAKDIPAFEPFVPQTKLPAKLELYVVTDYGAKNDKTKTDNTEAIQNALNDAAANGGGVVFIPAGHWRLDGTLTIPSGVELRGAMDNSSTPHGEGTILETYHGKGDFAAEPFISIEANGGLRGVTINYPEQKWTSNDYMPAAYPWAIRGLGENIYVINVGVRGCYAALDLFTNRCDNFYVDFMAGHMFNYGVRVGADSENGILSNVMCNTIVYACGGESKFGSFQNAPSGSNTPVYDYGYEYLEFFTLGDTKNLTLYNCFNFGANKGLKLVSDGNGGPDGISIGLGLDADEKAFYISEGVNTKNFDFINTQFVSLGEEDIYYIYSEANNDFDITLFASDYWGGPNYGLYMGENSGKLTLVNAQFQNAGNQGFAELYGGFTTIFGSNINNKDPLIKRGTDGQDYILISSSIADAAGIRTTDENWVNNAASSRTFSADGAIASSYDRSDWRTSASHGGRGKTAIDGNISTRWDTAKVQEPGMWFEVDFKEDLTFNYLILDIGSSTGDAPVEWEVFVSSDGENWGEAIASGERGNGIISFDEVTARYLRIEQNGSSSGNYWSIHEMYVCNME